jgi:hypothetical protein
VTLATFSYLLAFANIVNMFIALYLKWQREAAWLLIALQVPWTVWDVRSHYYGFLAISVVSVAIGIQTLRKSNGRAEESN